MNNITNLRELRAEKKRLQNLSVQQKTLIKNDVTQIKESLEPVNLLLNGISNITGVKFEKETFLKNGLAYGLSFVAQQYFIKAEQKVEEKLHDLSVNMVEKVKTFIESFLNKDKKKTDYNSDSKD